MSTGGRFKAWELVESELHIAQKQSIEPNAQRFDEQMIGVTWALAKNPRVSQRVPDTRLYVLKTDEFPEAPRLRIWFKFDEIKVDLLSIELIQQGEAS